MQVGKPEAISKETPVRSRGTLEDSIVPGILGHGGTGGLAAWHRRTGSVSTATHPGTQ